LVWVTRVREKLNPLNPVSKASAPDSVMNARHCASRFPEHTVDIIRPQYAVDSGHSQFPDYADAICFSQQSMSQAIHLEVEVPDDLARLRLPDGVQQRLTELLDKQDEGTLLTGAEQREAEGLVDLAELLSLLRMRSERMSSERS
jgi:hypothetical protein